MSEWYYMRGDVQHGPTTGHELKKLAAKGVLKPKDLVWNDTLPDWVEARRVKGLFPAGAAAAKTAPAKRTVKSPAKQQAPQHVAHDSAAAAEGSSNGEGSAHEGVAVANAVPVAEEAPPIEHAPATEQTPATEEAPAAEESPAEEAPAEETAAEMHEQTAEETPTEEPPAEEAPAEEAAEEAPAQEEEAPAEEQPAETEPEAEAEAAPAEEEAPEEEATLAAAAPIAYYQPTGGMPKYIAKGLAKFPPVTGTTGEWPLSEPHTAEMAETAKIRRVIRGLGMWFRFCSLMGLVVTAMQIVMLIFPASMMSSARFQTTRFMSVQMAVIGIMAGGTALFYLASRALYNCRIWAPIVMLILHAMGGLFYIGLGIYATIQTQRLGEPVIYPVIACSLVALVAGIICYFCIRAIIAIPKFLARPAWTVALMGSCEL